MKFSLERAFSTNAALLATVTDNIVPVNITPYMDGLSRASYELDDRSVAYMSATDSKTAHYIRLSELKESSENVSVLGDVAHGEIHYQDSSDSYARHDHRNERDRDRHRYGAREEFIDPRKRMAPGQRRYTMAAGNIPGTSLFKTERPTSAMLVCGEDQTPATRQILLLTIANNRIPEQRHRNFGTATKEVMIDTECFLVWYANFVKRSMGKNIYCPGIQSYLPNSCMGLEWESGGVPDELLDKHTLLSNALKEDLLFAASKHDDYHNIISISKCGFSALHNVIRLACPIIKEKVPNGFLLTYSDANDITVHVRRIHEYIL